MAFESLTERMSQAFKNLTGQGKLTEKNMNDMLKEVRMSLLEAMSIIRSSKTLSPV